MMPLIYHLVSPDAWQRAQADGVYIHPSLETEGFIHASYLAQLPWVANRFYQGQAQLVLLSIDPSQLEAVVRDDPVTLAPGEVVSFPHIYGPVNLSAVVRVISLTPAADGTFALPAGLA